MPRNRVTPNQASEAPERANLNSVLSGVKGVLQVALVGSEFSGLGDVPMQPDYHRMACGGGEGIKMWWYLFSSPFNATTPTRRREKKALGPHISAYMHSLNLHPPHH